MGTLERGVWKEVAVPPLLLAAVAEVCQGFMSKQTRSQRCPDDDEDWACSKELIAPNRKDVILRDLYPLSPPTFFLSYLLLKERKGLGCHKAWKDGRGIKTQ